MAVQKQDLKNGEPVGDDALFAQLLAGAAPPPARRRRSPGGPISGSSVDAAFALLLYAILALLLVASWIGTFYGIIGRPAPLTSVVAILRDVIAQPAVLFQAFAVQAFFTIVQWGARRRARTHSPAYWLLWLAGLAPSVYYNLGSYYAPMVAMDVPYVLAVVMIIGGDVIPEVFGQRD